MAWLRAGWPDFGPLVQRLEPSVGRYRCGFAQGHYKDSARQAGFAATKAKAAKCQKYHDLHSNYHFQPVAIETTGVNGKSTALVTFCYVNSSVKMKNAPPLAYYQSYSFNLTSIINHQWRKSVASAK